MLPAFWFVMSVLVLAGYAVLDGFDLGVGIVQPFVARTDDERSRTLLSIGQLWDGNEVWLIAAGAGLGLSGLI